MKHIFGRFVRWLLKPIDKHYTRCCKRRLKNNNFSILCNSCIGGSMYHRLGLEFLTPTINLSIKPKDFIKFLNNIDFYLSQEFVEIQNDKWWPAGMLGDIKVDFVHYKTFQEGVEAWNRRKERLNFSNLYIVIRDIHNNCITEDDINSLKINYNNVVVLTENKNSSKYFKTIKLRKTQEEHYRNLSNLHIWEAKWDWIKFINKK